MSINHVENKTAAPSEVVQAENSDVAEIFRWLEREYTEDGEGFWVNKGVIESSAHKGNLWIVRRNGLAAAFQTGGNSPEIFCVRKEWRRSGLGKILHEALVERALQAGEVVLWGECSPRDSWSYWQRFGYERYGSQSDKDPLNIRLVLPSTPIELPTGATKAAVVIAFYQENARYDSSPEALKTHEVTGVRLDDDSIVLERRIVGTSSDYGDLVVSIEVDGARVYFDKAKYSEAQEHGVESHSRGVFSIEWIYL